MIIPQRVLCNLDMCDHFPLDPACGWRNRPGELGPTPERSQVSLPRLFRTATVEDAEREARSSLPDPVIIAGRRIDPDDLPGGDEL